MTYYKRHTGRLEDKGLMNILPIAFYQSNGPNSNRTRMIKIGVHVLYNVVQCWECLLCQGSAVGGGIGGVGMCLPMCDWMGLPVELVSMVRVVVEWVSCHLVRRLETASMSRAWGTLKRRSRQTRH